MEAVLAHQRSTHVKATVVDNCNGTYSLAFMVASQGDWTLQTKVRLPNRQRSMGPGLSQPVAAV